MFLNNKRNQVFIYILKNKILSVHWEICYVSNWYLSLFYHLHIHRKWNNIIQLEYIIKWVLEILTIHSFNSESVADNMPLMNTLHLCSNLRFFFFFLDIHLWFGNQKSKGVQVLKESYGSTLGFLFRIGVDGAWWMQKSIHDTIHLLLSQVCFFLLKHSELRLAWEMAVNMLELRWIFTFVLYQALGPFGCTWSNPRLTASKVKDSLFKQN